MVLTFSSRLTEALHECERLKAENAMLKALLMEHGIAFDALEYSKPDLPVPIEERVTKGRGTEAATPSGLSPSEKIALFRRLFRGRTDVYPIRWENKAGKSGYAPACGNEWRAGVCEKPKIYDYVELEHVQLAVGQAAEELRRHGL